MDMDNITGLLEAILRETFNAEWEVEKEFGNEAPGIVINMRVNIDRTKNKVMEFFNGRMETFIKETFRMIWKTDMEKCTGQMEKFTKGNG